MTTDHDELQDETRRNAKRYWLKKEQGSETITDHDLLAKYTPLEACENVMSNHHEIEGQNYLGDPTRECAECGSYFPCEVYSFANALRAVVELKEQSHYMSDSDTEIAFTEGYNKCLADVKADIEKELG